MKGILNQLQLVFRREFAKIVSEYNKMHIDDEELEIYIDNFPTYYTVIDSYNNTVAEDERKENYKRIINPDNNLVNKFKSQAEQELALIKEELSMTERGYALEPTKAISKYNKERRLKKRIEDTEKTLQALDKLNNELAPPKRKVGRPRKNDNQEKT